MQTWYVRYVVQKVLFIYYNSSITIQSSVTHYQMSVPLSLPLNTIRLYHEFIHHSVIHTNPVGLLSLSFVNQSVFVKLLFLPVKRISQSFCNRQASPWHFLACFALGRSSGSREDVRHHAVIRIQHVFLCDRVYATYKWLIRNSLNSSRVIVPPPSSS